MSVLNLSINCPKSVRQTVRNSVSVSLIVEADRPDNVTGHCTRCALMGSAEPCGRPVKLGVKDRSGSNKSARPYARTRAGGCKWRSSRAAQIPPICDPKLTAQLRADRPQCIPMAELASAELRGAAARICPLPMFPTIFDPQ